MRSLDPGWDTRDYRVLRTSRSAARHTFSGQACARCGRARPDIPPSGDAPPSAPMPLAGAAAGGPAGSLLAWRRSGLPPPDRSTAFPAVRRTIASHRPNAFLAQAFAWSSFRGLVVLRWAGRLDAAGMRARSHRFDGPAIAWQQQLLAVVPGELVAVGMSGGVGQAARISRQPFLLQARPPGIGKAFHDSPGKLLLV